MRKVVAIGSTRSQTQIVGGFAQRGHASAASPSPPGTAVGDSSVVNSGTRARGSALEVCLRRVAPLPLETARSLRRPTRFRPLRRR